SLCQPDVSSENADSIMGFSGMGSSASDEVDWSRMRPKRKHFKQIVSNIVSNNFRPSGAVNYDTATGLAYTRACPDRDDHFRALSDQCSDDAPASLHCESDSTVYAVDHFR
ncbi:MAG TPA: hypothetical protein VL588_02195, partial [Bdellovibrionota bacterium]|nr:hypothetical protein [Bdellovibrionota bacterium]